MIAIKSNLYTLLCFLNLSIFISFERHSYSRTSHFNQKFRKSDDDNNSNNDKNLHRLFYFSDKLTKQSSNDILAKNNNDLTLIKYDANQINSYYSNRPFLVWERLVDIGSPVLGWWILKKYDELMSSFRSVEENNQAVNDRASDLKDAIVQGRSVTFIKSGQALALRPDIVKSSEYIRELTKLQDEVGTFDNKIAFEIIRQEFGGGVCPSEIYEFDPPTPIASASIGQVYRARLKPHPYTYATIEAMKRKELLSSSQHQQSSSSSGSGISDNSNSNNYVIESKVKANASNDSTVHNNNNNNNNINTNNNNMISSTIPLQQPSSSSSSLSLGPVVAVKVQRPDALSSASLDMFILRKLAALIKYWKKYNTDLVGIADQFGMQLYAELNYLQECDNCNRFKDLYGSIPGIYVPEAYNPLTTQRVLTMEFVTGVKGPWKVGGEKMLTIGLQCSVMQLLDTGYFHSDPHRGNLLQTPDGKLAYLDFGMMAEVPSQQRYALIGTVLGLVNKDIPLVISNLKLLEFFPANSDQDLIVNALDNAIRNATVRGETSSLNFTKLNQNLEAIKGIVPFQLPPFYSLIIRTLSILEGLALAVDKDFRLIKGAYPFIAKQLLTSNSEELEKLLKSVLLTSNNKIKWSKLEQFISIASNADKATQGNFQALKTAQDRTDLIKTYSSGTSGSGSSSSSSKVGKNIASKSRSKSSSSKNTIKISNNNNNNYKSNNDDDDEVINAAKINENFTPEATVQILQFLVSEKGRFLREPLILEIVDYLDNIGLTMITIIHLLSNNLIPAPKEKPNREKIDNVVKVMNIFIDVVKNAIVSSATAATSSSSSSVVSSAVSGGSNSATSCQVFIGLLENANQQISKLLLGSTSSSSSSNSNIISSATTATSSSSSAAATAAAASAKELSIITTAISSLLLQIISQLAERTARRTVRAILTPDAIKSLLPSLARAMDFQQSF